MALEHDAEVAKFDRYAQDYEATHAKSLKASGEGPLFFAQHKIRCLADLGVADHSRVLDFGCGIGGLTTLLAERYAEVQGFDPSEQSLAVARHRMPRVVFNSSWEQVVDDYFDVVILSGVLHHVPVVERKAVVARALAKLRHGGRLVVFEHNPFNPLTVRAVNDCPFDDDAVLLKPNELSGLFRDAGLQAVAQRFVLFFPKRLSLLRGFERHLRWCPLGAQTMTWGVRKGALD